MSPLIQAFFDPATSTYSYVVSDPATAQCAIIDSVLDYDAAAGRTDTASADRLIAYVREQGLHVQWLLETHVHADHLSAAPYLKAALGGQLAIGEQIRVVQNTFGKLFNAGSEFAVDGRQFDLLFKDDQVFQIGSLNARVLHTPGHTPACMTYLIGDAAFVGDTLFMPDYATARCDFPGGDARILFRSIHRLLSLPEDVVLYMCHDYAPNGRELRHVSTVGEQRRENVHVADAITEEQYVKMREARDATLAMPKLIIPSIQVNMKAGHLPEPESNGQRYLKVPINGL